MNRSKRVQQKRTRRTMRARGIAKAARIHGRKRLVPERVLKRRFDRSGVFVVPPYVRKDQKEVLLGLRGRRAHGRERTYV